MPNVVITDVKSYEAAQPRTLRVLVVDDDRDTVLSLTALLRTEQHDTRGLYSAADVLHHVNAYEPHVVILDIAMPGRTGWEAARTIRAGFPGKRPVLIGISGEHTRGTDRLHSKESGFDFYLMKPCDPKVILTLLRWVQIDSPFRSRIA